MESPTLRGWGDTSLGQTGKPTERIHSTEFWEKWTTGDSTFLFPHLRWKKEEKKIRCSIQKVTHSPSLLFTHFIYSWYKKWENHDSNFWFYRKGCTNQNSLLSDQDDSKYYGVLPPDITTEKKYICESMGKIDLCSILGKAFRLLLKNKLLMSLYLDLRYWNTGILFVVLFSSHRQNGCIHSMLICVKPMTHQHLR